MKKIASILAMLLMVLTISLSLNSCGGFTIGAAVGQLQSQCPKDMGGGLTMTNADLVNGNIQITISASQISSDDFDGDSFKALQAQNFKSDADFSKLLKDTKTSVVYKFQLADGEEEVTIAPSDL